MLDLDLKQLDGSQCNRRRRERTGHQYKSPAALPLENPFSS